MSNVKKPIGAKSIDSEMQNCLEHDYDRMKPTIIEIDPFQSSNKFITLMSQDDGSICEDGQNNCIIGENQVKFFSIV